ncbi:16S rRNA (adenine(1518)-N(6)/adenine(1519)-N(6))-dimethyltransferase, partial [Ruminococcaceae bacterium OttesenSCG-928-A11]|nr:16S rRNA (adenine(1518)-N(6)/adenine(1519)-N(6))-dimethyltransferase [Ruminococcaceae bacterium OttesenSCG-928-A11]
MDRLTDLSTIRALCEKHGFSLSKGFGQHFLVNPGICPKICAAAGIGPESTVLEIGPGFGTLTREAALRAKKVAALEVDRRLLPVLEETLAGFDNATVIPGDVLKADLAAIIRDELGGRATVCANLPYNITSPIVMRLLEEQ